MFFKVKLTSEQKQEANQVLVTVMNMIDTQTGSDEQIIEMKHNLENKFGFIISGVDKPTAFVRNLKELIGNN